MSWHDNAVHAIAWAPIPGNPGRLLLDIDYILQWDAPEPPARTLSFWISPATLAFEPAWDLTTDIDRTGWGFQLFLTAIRRSEPDESRRDTGAGRRAAGLADSPEGSA
jgi:hypothetical protein